MSQDTVNIGGLVALAKAAAAEAANYQERFGAEDIEARKIVDIIERFLRVKGRVVYGGAAINAHMPTDKRFYDPSLYLPDYDFMTPDPLQDCADLIVTFQEEGFQDVEAKFGIHEGTYKIFVNYRSAADITYMPPEIYDRVVTDAETIDGIRYASVNYLRMNIYLELSRPAGDVKRWEKVYERLLLLNEVHPLRAGRCKEDPLEALQDDSEDDLRDKIVQIGIDTKSIFLSAAHPPASESVVMLMSDNEHIVGAELKAIGLKGTAMDALGELLPARTEYRTKRRKLVAVVFETVACHSYTVQPKTNIRVGSLDLLIQMYYALYFADLVNYVSGRLLCVIQALIEEETERRREAVLKGADPATVFPLECIGHQPTMPELKKAHRQRVKEKRDELAKMVRIQTSGRVTRRKANKPKRITRRH